MFIKSQPLENKDSALLSEEQERHEEIKIRLEDMNGIILIFLISIFAIIFCTHTTSTIAIEKLGQFGDSFGVLTSFFTAMAFVGLFITIRQQRKAIEIQKEELRLNRKEMELSSKALQEQSNTLKLQQFENTFFKLLEHLSASIKNIKFINLTGSEATDELFNELDGRLFKTLLSNIEDEHQSDRDLDEINQFIENNLITLLELITPFTSCLMAVDKFCPLNQKSFYISILTAHLTSSENGLIYYYCLPCKLSPDSTINQNSCEALYLKLGIDISKMYVRVAQRHMNAHQKLST